jgi:hypothetical protein
MLFTYTYTLKMLQDKERENQNSVKAIINIAHTSPGNISPIDAYCTSNLP